MKRVLFAIFLVLCSVLLDAQNLNGNYNPYVNGGIISSSPLLPLEANGSGIIRFNIGNTGSDNLEVFANQFITLTITLSYGIPDNVDPLAALGGTSKGLFSWSYNLGTYTGIQTATIPSISSGTITIAYKVTKNSSSPGYNGFNVNISPAPYQTTSNTQNDDAVSSYTYTEIKDFGDAPSTYGTADHIIDFVNFLGAVVDGEPANQPSVAADADDASGLDDEDGIVFPVLKQGVSSNIAVTVVGIGYLNGWIDWNGDGDFDDQGERIAENIPRSSGTGNLAVSVPAGAIVSTFTFARFRFSPVILTINTASVNGGEVEDYQITVLSVSQIPTVPSGLAVSSSSVSSVSLIWNASTDNLGVTGYRIYRDGTYLGVSTVLTYIDNTVNSGNTYTYSVSAVDADANESNQSVGVIASTHDISAPSIPTGLQITSISANAISISWNAATDNLGVTGYKIFRGSDLLSTVTTLSFTDNTVTAGNSYTYYVSSVDLAGNESGQSSVSVIITLERELKTIKKMTIYPNPSNGRFIIEIEDKSGKFDLEIISDNGVIVERSTFFQSVYPIPFSFESLTTGVYYIRIFNKERVYLGKLMIHK